MIKIIFVCHGNICRSPAAECVFNQLVKANGLSQEFECYSRALTTEEIGNDIYPPMKQALIKKNIEFKHHEATLLDDLDIQWADYIVYMDDENKYCIDNYYQIEPNKLINLAKFIKKSEISDPWYHRGFESTLDQIINAITNLIKHLHQK